MTAGSRPWLSVLIPVFNVNDYLRETVASVLAQADAGVEILMADDCSTDGSTALVQALVAEHEAGPVSVRALLQTVNQGPSVSRNLMLQEACGDYIWFLDADDLMMPGAITRLREVIRQRSPALIMCDFLMLRKRKKLKSRLRGEMHCRTFIGPERQWISDPSVLMRGMFEGGHLHVWSKIAKRSVWGEHLRFPVGRYFEDVTLTPQLLLAAAGGVWYEPEVWVAYRQRAGSILATPNLLKANHQAYSLLPLRQSMAHWRLDDDASFAWAHFAASMFISACRTAERGLPQAWGDAVVAFRQGLERSAPMTPEALVRAYRRRGWFVRAARLNRWLKRATGDTPMLADSGFA